MDLRLLVFRLLPPKLRLPLWLEFFFMLIRLEYIIDKYNSFRIGVLTRLQYPNQALSIISLLESETGLSNITIEHLDSSLTDFIISPSAFNQDQPLLPPGQEGPVMRISSDPLQLYGAGFRVNAAGGSPQEELIRSIIDRYNHRGIIYELNL